MRYALEAYQTLSEFFVDLIKIQSQKPIEFKRVYVFPYWYRKLKTYYKIFLRS